MNIIDIEDEEKSDLPPAPPVAYPPPQTPNGPMKYVEARPASRGGFGFGRAVSEEGDWDDGPGLNEELSRRLDTIDTKLDWLITRVKATTSRPDNMKFDRNGSLTSVVSMADNSPNSSRAITEADKTPVLRSIADERNPEPPGMVVPPAPSSNDRGSVGFNRATRELGSMGDSTSMSRQMSGFASRKGSTQSNGGLMIPNLNRRHGRGGSGRSNISIPALFKSQFVARRMYEKSQNQDYDQMQKRIQSLPKAMRNKRSATVNYIYIVLDDPSSSNVAWWTATCLQALVLLSMVGTFLQTIEDPPLHGLSAAIVETVFDVVFLTEVILRWGSAPNRVKFVCDSQSWIDIVAASSIILRAAVGFVLPEGYDDSAKVYLLCVVPIFRLLKLVRHFETFTVLVKAFMVTMEALPMLLYAVALITLAFATLMYIVEQETFETPYRALWFCLATITTVGYGDYAPSTPAGITVAMILIVLGIILVAVPIGIIGMAFHETWATRDYFLLLRKTRSKLHQWGYTAHDIPTLFKAVDLDGNGVLELDEFVELVKEMKIGLHESRVVALFEHMDKDNSGALDAAEFALEVFPETFVEAFGHAEAKTSSGETDHWMSSLAAAINGGKNMSLDDP
jgi:voltage-gated potassium channel